MTRPALTRSRPARPLLLAIALAATVAFQACADFALEDLQYTVHMNTTELSPGSVVVTVNMQDAHRTVVLGPGHIADDVSGYVGGQYDATAFVQSTERLAMLRARRDEIARKLAQSDVVQGDLVALATELSGISAALSEATSDVKSCNGEFKDAAPQPGQGRATVQASIQADGTIFLSCN